MFTEGIAAFLFYMMLSASCLRQLSFFLFLQQTIYWQWQLLCYLPANTAKFPLWCVVACISASAHRQAAQRYRICNYIDTRCCSRWTRCNAMVSRSPAVSSDRIFIKHRNAVAVQYWRRRHDLVSCRRPTVVSDVNSCHGWWTAPNICPYNDGDGWLTSLTEMRCLGSQHERRMYSYSLSIMTTNSLLVSSHLLPAHHSLGRTASAVAVRACVRTTISFIVRRRIGALCVIGNKPDGSDSPPTSTARGGAKPTVYGRQCCPTDILIDHRLSQHPPRCTVSTTSHVVECRRRKPDYVDCFPACQVDSDMATDWRSTPCDHRRR